MDLTSDLNAKLAGPIAHRLATDFSWPVVNRPGILRLGLHNFPTGGSFTFLEHDKKNGQQPEQHTKPLPLQKKKKIGTSNG